MVVLLECNTALIVVADLAPLALVTLVETNANAGRSVQSAANIRAPVIMMVVLLDSRVATVHAKPNTVLLTFFFRSFLVVQNSFNILAFYSYIYLPLRILASSLLL